MTILLSLLLLLMLEVHQMPQLNGMVKDLNNIEFSGQTVISEKKGEMKCCKMFSLSKILLKPSIIVPFFLLVNVSFLGSHVWCGYDNQRVHLQHMMKWRRTNVLLEPYNLTHIFPWRQVFCTTPAPVYHAAHICGIVATNIIKTPYSDWNGNVILKVSALCS